MTSTPTNIIITIDNLFHLEKLTPQTFAEQQKQLPADVSANLVNNWLCWNYKGTRIVHDLNGWGGVHANMPFYRVSLPSKSGSRKGMRFKYFAVIEDAIAFIESKTNK